MLFFYQNRFDHVINEMSLICILSNQNVLLIRVRRLLSYSNPKILSKIKCRVHDDTVTSMAFCQQKLSSAIVVIVVRKTLRYVKHISKVKKKFSPHLWYFSSNYTTFLFGKSNFCSNAPRLEITKIKVMSVTELLLSAIEGRESLSISFKNKQEVCDTDFVVVLHIYPSITG